ncbi:MAG: Smr/MutS family protein [Thermodesulfobacteriota bacterium]|nr:Smr/MutS family protein [Thermodesulfobacteriota bacterium]
MIEHTYQVLGYQRLLDIVSCYASCPLGQSDCLSLTPSNDKEFIDNELSLVSEARLLLKMKEFVSFSDLNDIVPILRKGGVRGSCLSPDELLSILMLAQAGQRMKKLFSSNRSLCSGMYDLVRDIPECDALVGAIEATISLSGEVKDSASTALKKIRAKRIQLRSYLQRKLEMSRELAPLPGDSQDYSVTIRDGRYVIAIRSDQKSRIDGIIHGYSQTRATCFLEPIEVVQDNNRAAELRQEESAEEHRILTGLTVMVGDVAADLEYCQSLISRVDGLYARARFSEALSCIMPEMGEKHGVELKGAKNPILLAMALGSEGRHDVADSPVPVDILLDHNQNILIISGPNRGGKTVTLKTLGLMSLMAQAGIHIPAKEGSCLPVFERVMADIGDDQDIQTGLSTFSAHAEHLRYITEHASQKNLVIIDEPGMGTDPDEGVALAMAVLDFLSRQGTFVAVSTHFNRLKAFGLLNRRAANASVEFDPEGKRPTFRLNYGSPGISHAMETARDIGVPSNILDQAKRYLDQDEVHLNRLTEKLNHLLAEASREKAEANAAKRKYHSAAKKVESRLITLEAEKRALMETKKAEADAAIGEARTELRQVINQLKKNKEPFQARATERYAEVSRSLIDHFDLEGSQDLSTLPKKIEKGGQAYHRKLRQTVVVQSVDCSAGRALVTFGKVKISADIQDLEMVKDVPKPGQDKAAEPIFQSPSRSVPKELNVIGYRIDDAIPLIDRTIDRALVDGKASLKIIHGFGTGRLREAIRSHLKDVPFIKRICSADAGVGGDAITVVELS